MVREDDHDTGEDRADQRADRTAFYAADDSHDLPRQLTVAERFARISQDLLAEGEHETTLELVVHRAVETISAADECGVCLRRAQAMESPASTSPLVQELDELQHRLAEGPCWDTIWTLDTRIVTDVSAEQRWPRWAPAAAQLGIGSVLSVRLMTAASVIGSISLYSYRAHAFDNTDVAAASIFARHAASALAVADRAAGLRTALLTRQAIGAAQGMLMQRYGLDLDQSFEVLRRYSQMRNIKVRELAERMVRAGGITDSLEDAFDLDPSPDG